MFENNHANSKGAGMIAREGSTAQIHYSTFLANDASSQGGGICVDNSAVVLHGALLWDNLAPQGKQYFLDGIYQFDVSYSVIPGGFTGPGNIGDDPLLITGPAGNAYLSQILAGQLEDSPALNSSDEPAGAACIVIGGLPLCLSELTTRTDGQLDSGTADIGYHYSAEPATPTPLPTGTGEPTETPPITATPTGPPATPTLDPSPTWPPEPTEEPSPAPPTATATPTADPDPTATPAATEPPPTATPAVSPSPTPTAPPTVPPTATSTPPATPAPLAMNLDLNAALFRAGDLFLLTWGITHETADSVSGHAYILLDVAGSYWFWPSWSQTPSFQTVALGPGESVSTDAALDFVWPAGDFGEFTGILFWGALVDTSDSFLLADPVRIEWGYTG